MYALFIFSAYALPSLLLMGALLYDSRLLSSAGIAYFIIGALCVYEVQAFLGSLGIIGGSILLVIDILNPRILGEEKQISVKKGDIKRGMSLLFSSLSKKD